MKAIVKRYIFSLLSLGLLLSSCESAVDGINTDPNHVNTEQVDAGLYVNTPELALASDFCGLYSRLSALWTGQLFGTNQVPLMHYNYQVTESTFDFNGYHNVITQCQHIQKSAPDNLFYQGITRVMEAMLFGTYASFYGDVPCSEVGIEDTPKFDEQKDVFEYSQKLLDAAVDDLKSLNHVEYLQDYFYSGSATKWIEAAYTLKARFYMITKDYDSAYKSALNGISSDDNTMYFRPVDDNLTTDKNYYYTYNSIIQGIGTVNQDGDSCYLFQLMKARQNAKTDETARMAYYTLIPSEPTSNKGFFGPLEPEALVSYAENQLILAEAGARTQSFSVGLAALNVWRQYLNDGGCANSTYRTLSHRYEAYTADDFKMGGLLNTDGLDQDRALLREIIRERYISGFTTFMPFDDARRLRGTGETDIAVDIPLNTTSASTQPERFLYPSDEMLSNPNAPEEPGLYTPTDVNKK